VGPSGSRAGTVPSSATANAKLVAIDRANATASHTQLACWAACQSWVGSPIWLSSALERLLLRGPEPTRRDDSKRATTDWGDASGRVVAGLSGKAVLPRPTPSAIGSTRQ
jgi:hypothetical protein